MAVHSKNCVAEILCLHEQVQDGVFLALTMLALRSKTPHMRVDPITDFPDLRTCIQF